MKCFVVRVIDGDDNDVDYRLNAKDERTARKAALKEHRHNFGEPYTEIHSIEEHPFDAEMPVDVEIYEW